MKFKKNTCLLFLAFLLGGCALIDPDDLLMPPTLSVQDATEISANTATLHGKVSGNTAGISLDKLLFRYSTSMAFPDDADHTGLKYVEEGSSLSDLRVNLTDLKTSQTYFFRLEANSGATTVMSDYLNFTTMATLKPTFSNLEVLEKEDNSITVQGAVLEKNNKVLLEKGISYMKDGDKNWTSIMYEGAGGENDPFTMKLDNLMANTIYHVRLYAKTTETSKDEGSEYTGYGATYQVTTNEQTRPVVTLDGDVVTSLNSITASATITENAKGDITEGGFVWSTTNTNPTKTDTDSKYKKLTGVPQLNVKFSDILSGLTSGTRYYVRAYASNRVDGIERTGYSTAFVFTTDSLFTPTLKYSNESSDFAVNSTNATAKAEITNYKEEQLLEKGFLYHASVENMTLETQNVKKVVVKDKGNGLQATLSGLTPNTHYYLRAYAIYKVGTQQKVGYSESRGIDTPGTSNLSVAASASLIVGETYTLVPTGAYGTVTFASSDTKVATIDAKGVMKAVGAGAATITVKDSYNTKTCVVTVNNKISVQSTLALVVEEVEQLIVSNASGPVTWASSNTSVVEVNGAGVVTAKGTGTAEVTVSDSRNSAVCKVTVTASMSLPTSLVLLVKETGTLKAENPKGTVTWTSSNPSVATVDAQGVVTALSAGETVVMAKDSKVIKTCLVSVKNRLAIPAALNLLTDETETLVAQNALGTVTWSSSNTAVATVSAGGVVATKAAGTAVITAKDGKSTATCTVTVANPMAIPASVELLVNETQTLKVEYAQGTVAWSSSNPTVAKIDATGKITALAVGEAVVIAKDSKTVQTCAVSVRNKLTLAEAEATIVVGETYTVKTEGGLGTIAWTSSDTKVATVDAKGVVTAKAAGTVTITAKDSRNTVTCQITVNKKMTLTDAVTLNIGESKTLAVSDPTGAVTWTSSNTSVAVVDGLGKVTARKAGTATITAKDSRVELTCKVTVTSSLALSTTELNLISGTFYTLKALSPSGMVTWSSSDTKVATVSDLGLVSAVSLGTATITADDGYKKVTCTVTVTGKLTVPNSVTLAVGYSQILKTTNAVGTVTWSSSDTSVATVDATGKVTAKKVGKAVITAKDSKSTATCTVLVDNVDGSATIKPGNNHIL